MNYGPPGSKSLVYFVDDLNMPKLDPYETAMPISLIRQHLGWGHWWVGGGGQGSGRVRGCALQPWPRSNTKAGLLGGDGAATDPRSPRFDRAKLTQKNIHNTQYVAAMNPTAGAQREGGAFAYARAQQASQPYTAEAGVASAFAATPCEPRCRGSRAHPGAAPRRVLHHQPAPAAPVHDAGGHLPGPGQASREWVGDAATPAAGGCVGAAGAQGSACLAIARSLRSSSGGASMNRPPRAQNPNPCTPHSHRLRPPLSLMKIYGTFLMGHLSRFKEDVQEMGTKILQAALALHEKVSTTFRRTAVNFHYEFTVRQRGGARRQRPMLASRPPGWRASELPSL